MWRVCLLVPIRSTSHLYERQSSHFTLESSHHITIHKNLCRRMGNSHARHNLPHQISPASRSHTSYTTDNHCHHEGLHSLGKLGSPSSGLMAIARKEEMVALEHARGSTMSFCRACERGSTMPFCRTCVGLHCALLHNT